MPQQSSAETLNLVAQAKQMGINAEQQSVALLMQRIAPLVIAQLLIDMLRNTTATAATEFVSKIELVEKQVALEAQLSEQKPSSVAKVSQFRLMAERASKAESEEEAPTPTTPTL